MPSEDRAVRALEALSEDRDAFRSSVARAVDEVGGLLDRQRSSSDVERSGRSLGAMAEGRIDPDRFASLLGKSDALEPEALEQLERAHEVLTEIHDEGDDLHRVRLEEGGSLRDAVAGATARMGRAFGAARTAELARSGRFRLEDHGGYLDAFPFGMWNTREREIAPPLVVELAGRDLRPAGLCEFLDGGAKIALVVDGTAPPASLVRLVTPGVLVVQSAGAEGLAPFGEHEGAAVGALFDDGDGVARFTHRPDAGEDPASRLTVEELPGDETIRPVGTISRRQQLEELRQLEALSRLSAAASASENGGAPDGADEAEAEPADRLAGWLLRQSGLDQVEG